MVILFSSKYCDTQMMFLACTTVHYLINLLIADRDGTHSKLGLWVVRLRRALKGADRRSEVEQHEN